MKRLDRIDAELMRLEDEYLAAKIYHDQEKGAISPKERAKLRFYEQRIAQLSERREELQKMILQRSEKSVNQLLRQRELDRLQRVSDDMAVKLEILDIEASAPPRIQQVQPALVTGAGKTSQEERRQ